LQIAALLVATRDAHANPDPPSLDPRANAMGGAGVTFSEGAAGLGINPSLMQYSDKGDVILSAYVLHTGVHAPVSGPGARDQSSVSAPVGLVAASWRLTPKLVVGIGAQPTAGAGVDYHLAGGAELKGLFEVIELDVGASYALAENFWIGAAYRPSYFSASLTEPTPTPTNPIASTKLSLSKFDPAGAIVGVHYTPEPDTNLALVYRTRLTSEIDGTATTPFGTFDATSHFASPDKVTLGIDHHFLDNTLLLSAQVELILYGALPGTTNSTVKTPAGTQVMPVVADDKTIYETQVGAEYWVLPKCFAVRAGLYFGPDENRAEHIGAINPNIGYAVAPTAGLGVRLGPWNVDASVNWQIRHGETVDSTTGGNPGRYTTGGVIAGAGAVLHF
jgi:hypothetical protein